MEMGVEVWEVKPNRPKFPRRARPLDSIRRGSISSSPLTGSQVLLTFLRTEGIARVNFTRFGIASP